MMIGPTVARILGFSEIQANDCAQNVAVVAEGKTPAQVDPAFFVAVVCYCEKRDQATVVLWAGGQFYRIPLSDFEFAPKPLTPIWITTNSKYDRRLTSATGHGRYCYSAELRYQGGLMRRPLHVAFSEELTGMFTANGQHVTTFIWNPDDFFVKPIIVSLPLRNLPTSPAVIYGHTATVTFRSAACTHYAKEAPYPEVARIISLTSPGDIPVVCKEPLEGGPPEPLLSDLTTMPAFNVLYAIGLSENDYFPTLSYTDYHFHSTRNSLNTENIESKICARYAAGGSGREANKERFTTQMNKHRRNEHSGNKSILLYPGVWPDFTLRHANTLAPLLRDSGFQVVITAKAHPHTTMPMCVN